MYAEIIDQDMGYYSSALGLEEVRVTFDVDGYHVWGSYWVTPEYAYYKEKNLEFGRDVEERHVGRILDAVEQAMRKLGVERI